MANLTEISQWENVIRQLENGEAATGGADGLANIQAKQLANRTQWLKDNYLPLAGGKIVGNIYKNVDNGSLGLYGGSAWNKGAYLLLNGNNKTDGEGKISLMSILDETNYSELIMAPNGSLGFRPQKNGDIHDLAGSAIVAKSLGENGYIKYASGLIIQWGRIHIAPYDGLKIYSGITCPIAFTQIFTSVASKGWPQSTKPCSIEIEPTQHATAFKLNVWNFTNSEFDNGIVNWLAIGV